MSDSVDNGIFTCIVKFPNGFYVVALGNSSEEAKANTKWNCEAVEGNYPMLGMGVKFDEAEHLIIGINKEAGRVFLDGIERWVDWKDCSYSP